MGQVSVPQTTRILSQGGVPSGRAPTGTVGANGALTLGTALQFTYGPSGAIAFPGIWLLFPAGAVFAGSPLASFWVVMISATQGTIFGNTLAVPGARTPPAILVPIVDPGPGAYVGVTTDQNFIGVAIPPNGMGSNGVIRAYGRYTIPANANNKTFRTRLAGSAMIAPGTASATALTFSTLVHIVNCGRTDTQVGNGDGASSGAGAINEHASIDTTIAQILTIGGAAANDTDYIILDAILVELMPSA